MNEIHLTGEIIAGPRRDVTEKGRDIADALMIVPRASGRRGKEMATDIYNLNFWGPLADVAMKLIHCGDKVYVSGCLNPRIYKDAKGKTKMDLQVYVRQLDALAYRGEGADLMVSSISYDESIELPCYAGFTDRS